MFSTRIYQVFLVEIVLSMYRMQHVVPVILYINALAFKQTNDK